MLKRIRRGLVPFVAALLVACGGGGGSGSSQNASANHSPQAVMLASGSVAAEGTTLQATVGGMIHLDGATSSDADNDVLTYEWSLVSKPAASSTTLPASTGSSIDWQPDAVGNYVIALKVTDSKGASSTQQITLSVTNRPPVSSVQVSVAFTPVPSTSAPQSVTVGANLTLDASASADPDGDPLTVSFEFVAKPAGSTASLSTTGSTAGFVPERAGTYKVKAIGSDGRGARFEATYVFVADNSPPVASTQVSVQFTPVASTWTSQSVTVGSSVSVDASGSTDPDGDPVTVNFGLIERPTGSSATLSTASRTASFVPDVPGTFKVKVAGADSHGASFDSTYIFNADNRAPNPVLTASVRPVVANAGQNYVAASVGYDVILDGSASTDPEGQTVVHAWSLVSKPSNSHATLSAASGASTALSPDQLGDYVVTLIATDAQGAQSSYTTTVQVRNRRPVAAISSNATPQALPSAVTTRVPAGTRLTLSGAASVDADGDPLTFLWQVTSAPTGSTATLSSSTASNPTFVPDVDGNYSIRLRATDSGGAYSEKTLDIEVGTHTPFAVVDRDNVTTLVGTAMHASAAMSYDIDGDLLTYQWEIVSQPANSAATLTNATDEAVTFTPDAPGIYGLRVTVRDGQTASQTHVTINALARLRGAIALNFIPLYAQYSTGLDKLVVLASNPNAVFVVDPFTAATQRVDLNDPTAFTLGVSPDGRLAAVLTQTSLSLVDLSTATLIQTSPLTSNNWQQCSVDNAGKVFLFGTGMGVMDGRTGAWIPQTANPIYWGGGGYGVFSDRYHKVFSPGLYSPQDLWVADFDLTNYQITNVTSRWEPVYQFGGRLYLSENQNILFSAVGQYFSTGTLSMLGTLAGVSAIQSFSHSGWADEVLVFESGISLPASYKRFYGPVYQPDTDMALPLVNGNQSYGLQLFHSANGSHVLLVQTGTSQSSGSGAQYFAVTRGAP